MKKQIHRVEVVRTIEGHFRIDGITTPQGRPLVTPSPALASRVAQELLTNGHADPTIPGHFSMLCSMIDFVTPNTEALAPLEDVLIQTDFVLPDFFQPKSFWKPLLNSEMQSLLGIQEGSRVLTYKELTEHLKTTLRELSPARKTAFINLNSLHNSGLLLPLLFVREELPPTKYMDILCHLNQAKPGTRLHGFLVATVFQITEFLQYHKPLQPGAIVVYAGQGLRIEKDMQGMMFVHQAPPPNEEQVLKIALLPDTMKLCLNAVGSENGGRWTKLDYGFEMEQAGGTVTLRLLAPQKGSQLREICFDNEETGVLLTALRLAA